MKKTLMLTTVLTVAASQFACAPLRVMSKQNFTCPDHGLCTVEVYASVGSDQACKVTPQYYEVHVLPNNKQMVVWQIVPTDPHDPYDYQFTDLAQTPRVNGVDILKNDPNKDFESPGYDNGNKKRFRWTSKHVQPGSFDYELNVLRRAHGSHGNWTLCDMVDPKIVND